MIKFSWILCGALCLFANSPFAASLGIGDGMASDATVYYFPFEIQRLVGIPENQIESYGCLYYGDFRKLSDMMKSSPPAKEAYEAGDVRVKVIGGGEVLYIDARGIAKTPSGLVKIDTAAFGRLIHPSPGASCPRLH